MKTWWIIGQAASSLFIDHWFQDGNAVYSVILDGTIEKSTITVYEMHTYVEKNYVCVRYIPASQAKRISNNRDTHSRGKL